MENEWNNPGKYVYKPVNGLLIRKIFFCGLSAFIFAVLTAGIRSVNIEITIS